MTLPITWAITAHNEITELSELIPYMIDMVSEQDEILLQVDSSSPESDKVLELASKFPRIKTITFPLRDENGAIDFARYKNNLGEKAENRWIFQLDADELPSKVLIDYAGTLPIDNPDTGLFFIPRINEVTGITRDHISKWGWSINEHGYVNWPDYQSRFYEKSLQWQGAVHERITPETPPMHLPASHEFALYHRKHISKQELQNNLYATI